jgi:catechol-2,3-dioxygenase
MTGPELAMPSRITAGAVVYARDVNRVSAFYAGVVGLEVRSQRPPTPCLSLRGPVMRSDLPSERRLT